MNLRTTAPAGPADVKLLRRAFGTFATGVTVVTAPGAHPHGMTANSFTSVSLDPPLLLVCIGKDALMHDRLEAAGSFGVSVLASHQESLARHFADRWQAGPAQFDEVGWRAGTDTGVPLIDDCLAAFECELVDNHDGGDHVIVIGRLLSVRWSGDAAPLLFFGGRFSYLESERGEVAS